jgi:hypothetical protein
MKFTLPTFFASLLYAAPLSAQRPILETQEAVVASAITQLDSLMKDEKFLKMLVKEEVHGNHTYQIGVGDKGQINTMRALSQSENASIDGQNYLNNLVKVHKFDFKLPKGNFYKFEYTFRTP